MTAAIYVFLWLTVPGCRARRCGGRGVACAAASAQWAEGCSSPHRLHALLWPYLCREDGTHEGEFPLQLNHYLPHVTEFGSMEGCTRQVAIAQSSYSDIVNGRLTRHARRTWCARDCRGVSLFKELPEQFSPWSLQNIFRSNLMSNEAFYPVLHNFCVKL